jgi:hypothetical protein
MQRNDLIVIRTYLKAGKVARVLVRRISSDNVSETVDYQLEFWPDAEDDQRTRVTASDRNFVRDMYQAKLRELQDEGWSKKDSPTCLLEDEARFFDPDSPA